MNAIIYYYQFHTRHGSISLIPQAQGRYIVMYEEENLGSYNSPEAAADDVSGGHTFSPSSGVEFDELDIPGDLEEWERKKFASISKLKPA